jgi:hypothetical protein
MLLLLMIMVQVGVGGGGGEYVPQMGFGWSNGVALSLLQYTTQTTTVASDDDDSEVTTAIKIVVLGVIMLTVIALGVLGYFYLNKSRSSAKETDNNNINLLRQDSVKSSLI